MAVPRDVDLEARLRESESRFELLAKDANDLAIFRIDTDGRIVSWNEGARRILGYEASEIIGVDLEILFTPEDRVAGAPATELRTAVERGSASHDGWRVRKDGSRFFATGAVIPIRSASGDLSGFWKIMRDRTGERQWSDRLAMLHERFEIAQRAGGLGAFAWDIASGLVEWTDALCVLYGLAPGGFSGCVADWLMLVLPEDRTVVQHLLDAPSALQCRVEGRFRIRRPDGEVRWLDLQAEIHREYDRPIRVVGVNVDVTEHKRLTDRLSESNTQLDQFAAIASHDLQAPLRTVASYLGLLRHRMREGFDAAHAGYLHKAIEGTERMQRLLQHLLEFARVGNESIRVEPLESLEAFAEAVRNLGTSIEESSATITHDEMPRVLAHRDHLTRLFQNLLANALKYARADVRPEVHVSARLGSGGLDYVFSVADNGVGIQADDQERVFNAFERVADTAHRPGNGLGLAICRKIVERHGGRIWLTSEVGIGSTFHFTLRSVVLATEAGGAGVPKPLV